MPVFNAVGVYTYFVCVVYPFCIGCNSGCALSIHSALAVTVVVTQDRMDTANQKANTGTAPFESARTSVIKLNFICLFLMLIFISKSITFHGTVNCHVFNVRVRLYMSVNNSSCNCE